MLLLFDVSKVELRHEVGVGVMVKPSTDPSTPRKKVDQVLPEAPARPVTGNTP